MTDRSTSVGFILLLIMVVIAYVVARIDYHHIRNLQQRVGQLEQQCKVK